jgi:hypothetical protein
MLDDQATREATGAAAPPGNEPAKAPLATDRAPVEDRVMVASQRQLIWWRFRKHKLALCGAVVVVLFYLLALGGDFFAYADPNQPQGDYVLVPPRGIALRVHPLESSRDPLTLQPIYAPDMSRTIPVRLFAHGYRYKLFGLIPTNIHLIGTSRGSAGASLFILGTDEQGRDVFSRLVLATRTSLFIGLVGVALSVLIGVVLGGLSGYYGGLVDTVDSTVDGVGRGRAPRLERRTHVLRHHPHRLADRLGRPGAGRPWTVPAGAPRGLRAGRGAGGRPPAAAHLRAHAAAVHQPHHRRGHPGDPVDDHRGDVAELPRARPASSGGVVGGDAPAGAERAVGRQLAVDAPASHPGGDRDFVGDGLRDAADPYD